jgi:transposase
VVWTSHHHTSQFECAKVINLFQENQRISQRDKAEKLKVGSANANEITVGLGYARPHTNAATSVAIENIGFEVVPHPCYSPDLVPSYLWLFAALQKHLKGIHFTCDEEVQAAKKKRYRGEPKDFYCYRLKNLSALVSYQMTGRPHRKMKYRNKVHNMNHILGFVSFQYLV